MANHELWKISSVRDTVTFVEGGREVPLMWADAGIIEMMAEIEAGNWKVLPDAIRRVLPDATEDELRRLTFPQQMAALALACGGMPNLGESSGGATTTVSPTPPSPPSTS